MKLRLIALAVGWLAVGCGDDGHDPTPYATYQACFDVHAEGELVAPVDAILSCCLAHPIAGERPACGDTTPDCINYLTANLNQISASTVEKQDACAAYEQQR